MKNINLEFEDIIGRYFNLKVKKQNYRIYVEEAGKGTPLLCLHTAGSDGRQFRHILNDKKNKKVFEEEDEKEKEKI